MVLAFYFLEAVFNKGTLLGRLHLFIAYRTNADTERDRWTDRTNRHSNKVGRKAKTWLGRQADKHTNIQQFVRIQGMYRWLKPQTGRQTEWNYFRALRPYIKS